MKRKMILPYRVPRKFSRVAGRAFKTALTMYRPGATRLYRPLGNYVMNNRASIMRAAALVKRFAKWRYDQRKEVGERVGSSTCRRETTVDEAGLLTSRTLYTTSLTGIDEGQGNNQRMRDQINLRGVKIILEVSNTKQTAAIFLNVAVLNRKTATQGTGDPDITDFFRDHGQGRSINFDTALATPDFHLRPINADKYAILAHRRYSLSARNLALDHRAWDRLIELYIPIKRQIRYRYADAVTESPTDNAYLVYWYDFGEQIGGESPIPQGLKWSHRTVCYFRNTKD